MSRLDDRVALVTGAGRGVGRATALRLAAEGARVVVNDLSAEPAHETVDAIKAAGGQAVADLANVVDSSASREMVRAAVRTYGKLDILVNSAGVLREHSFHDLSDEEFETVLNVNLKGAFHATRAAMAYLRDVARDELAATGTVAYHRKITFTGAASALTGRVNQFAYTAAKGALIASTRTLALELGPYWVNVNAVAPGVIDASGSAAPADPATLRPAGEGGMLTAIPRAGRPEDVARVHLFLCSTDSDYVTGVTIPVTGGSLGAM